MKVEVAVLGSPSLIVRRVCVDVKQRFAVLLFLLFFCFCFLCLCFVVVVVPLFLFILLVFCCCCVLILFVSYLLSFSLWGAGEGRCGLDGIVCYIH